jgi:hypothetical protein
MNQNQKIATGLGLTVFVLTIIFAPWEFSITSEGTRFSLGTKFSPVWLAPTAENFRIQPAKTLMFQSLMIEWFALAVLYVGAFHLLKGSTTSNQGNPPPLPDLKVRLPRTSELTTTYKVIGTLLLCGGIGAQAAYSTVKRNNRNYQQQPVASILGSVTPSILLSPVAFWMLGRFSRKSRPLPTSEK